MFILIDSSKSILESLGKVICQPDWTVKMNDKDVLAVEDAGIHMCLKKLAILDKTSTCSLGEAICENMEEETVSLFN